MENNLLNELVETYPVALYDMEISDIQERTKKRLEFKTAIKAANFLGASPKKFYGQIGIGKYVYHRVTGKKYAARKLSKSTFD